MFDYSSNYAVHMTNKGVWRTLWISMYVFVNESEYNSVSKRMCMYV